MSRSPLKKRPVLWMAKGFNSAKNKQAALAKKLELAKKQQGKVEAPENKAVDEKLTERELELAEFAQLLAQSQPVQQRDERVFTQSERQAPSPNAGAEPKLKARAVKKKKTAAAKKLGEF